MKAISADTKGVWEMRWLTVHVPVPTDGTDDRFWHAVWGWDGYSHLQIERAKILWMLIEHHDVPVQTDEAIAVA
jgi:hypothetical protein